MKNPLMTLAAAAFISAMLALTTMPANAAEPEMSPAPGGSPYPDTEERNDQACYVWSCSCGIFCQPEREVEIPADDEPVPQARDVVA